MKHATDDHLCFRYTDSTNPFILTFNPYVIFCCCEARFVSDLVGNPKDRFSYDAPHISGVRPQDRTNEPLCLMDLHWTKARQSH